MHRVLAFAILLALLAAPVSAADVRVNKLSDGAARAWTDYTAPLPKSIEIRAEALVPRGGVWLQTDAAGKSPIYDQIRGEFDETCGARRQAGGSSFSILIRIAPELGLPNADQAYKISTSADTLTITAQAPEGAYYGWKTLQQLIAGRSTKGTLKVPVLTVTDWPDMERRGFWGTDNYNHVRWLADRKINHLEQINARGIDAEGKFWTRTKDGQSALDKDCPRYGIHYTPVVLHLEQVLNDDMRKRYPEMQGVNVTHKGAMCYAQPKVIEMISEWIYQLAQHSTYCEVDVWLSENTLGKEGCRCETCGREYHAVNEYRAVIKAWEAAKKKLGRDITLFLLTSETTEDYNRRMFAEIPGDVRIWYYHSLLTYQSIRAPMLRTYLANATRDGRWMGVCPNVDGWTHTNQPFTGAAFIKYRMGEFISRGQKGLLGYATPRIHYNKFNVEACAEWTWNLTGRSTREFARTYAVRRGYRDPGKFAEWSETLCPVAWDMHGSSWPFGQTRDTPEPLKVTLLSGKVPPLGTVIWDCFPSPWGNVKDEKQLNDDLAAMRKAIRLARELGIPECEHETMVIDGYLKSMKAMYDITKLVPEGGEFADKDKPEANRLWKEFFAGLKQSVDYLPKWEDCVRGETEKDFDFTERPINFIREIATGLAETAEKMGAEVQNPLPVLPKKEEAK